MLQRAASNAYSWWWASHIRTKQSKWLDNNLQDMEEKVKSMIKLIEEDADSFAKKAEMYYKRRPELINFVQETYKSYRALAERYDHISGELHKANNTIATVFPDQVQFGMEEEEDDSSPKAAAVDSSKFRNGKAPPPTPPVTENKNTKPPAIKTKQKHKRASSQTSKDKAQEEVDKLQKEILVLQTEKEFIKGSYENGLAKYWDIETKITEMQEKVCSLQEEFSADAVIEDDEARALMAVTALKSCEDTLVNLHEQQKKSAEEAKAESQRIKGAREKLRALRKEYGQPQADTMDSSEEVANQNSDVCGLNQERLEVQSVCEKVKKNFQMNSEMSILDLAEKIDELVGKVIALETTVSSQTAQIQRLSLETDELQKNLQTLEEEMSLIDDSKGLSEKVRQAEEELHRIQELDKSVQDDGSKLQTHFTEALHSFNDLSDKLQSPKHQDQVEIADNGDIANDSQLQREHKEKEDLEAPDETQGTKEIAMSAREQIVSPETSCIPDNSTKESDKPKEGNEVENSGSSQEDKNSPVNSAHDNGAGKLEEAGKELDDRSMDSLQVNGDHQKKSAEHDDLHLVNWQQLFVEGLEDRERILLTEYTCILRNYKDTKRKLAEAEKKNQDDLFETTAQIRDLKNAIAKRDEEIRSLRKKLNFVEASWNENSDVNAAEPKASHSKRLASTGSEEGPPLYTFLSGNFESMLNSELWKGKNVESAVAGDRKPGGGQEGTDSPLGEGNDLQPIERPHALSAIEERFRKDIDELLEENLEFWLRFSSSFQQIHKYQTSVEELQAEIPKLKDRKKQEGSTTSSGEQSVKPEASLIYKQLRDLQTDLEVWLEQNALLKEELQSRFSSLCNIKEEILKVLKDSEEDKEVQFTACQASKFQGEVLNMQQENNKVADELQAGLDHVKGLQAEVEKALVKLNDNFELSGSKNSHHYHFRNFSSKTRVPLRSFLFGAKPKKQSIFSCMNPAFQKQISDLRAGIPP